MQKPSPNVINIDTIIAELYCYVSSHGDAEQGVAPEQYVGLAQPQQPRVPGLVIHIQQEEHAGDDVAAEGDEHQGLSTLI